MDAISFVLGIKSSHLRSSHLRDLVYRGRVLQHSTIQADGTATEATNGDANGQAQNGAEQVAAEEEDEVDTQASTQRDDPKTAWVMAVYKDDAGEEQSWKRSITASGASEYRINNRVVNNKVYNEALEAEQILIKARNFLVFQGDVEAIASQSSKDLTRLIEQISGSLEYKTQYEELKAAMESKEEDHQAKIAQRRGINSEVRQFQEQKREADNYAKKQNDLDQAIVTHVLWKLYNFQKTIEDSTEEIQKHQEELKEFRRNVATYENQLDDAKRDQAKSAREVTKTEGQIKRKEKEIEDKENSLLPINEKILLSEQKIDKSNKRIGDIKKERESQQRTVDKMNKDIANVQKAQTKWEQERQASQRSAGRELSAADVQEYGRLRTEVSKETSAAQIQVDTIGRQLRTEEETVNSLKSKVDSTQNTVTRLDTEITELRTRRGDLDSGIKSLTKEVDNKKKEFNTMTSERLRTAQNHRELEEKLQEVLYKLADANASRNESDKEARARETVATMKRIYPGVRGQLWTLVKPKQKKYSVAVSTVLGRHHDAIVVDTEKTAKDCIQHLREQRAGQATFIPLDTIMHKAPDANLKGMHPGMRLAVDTVEYDNAIERAVSYACGNSIVCDTLKVAKHLCYERHVEAKAVTLDGTVIHKAGLMTGGQGPDQKNARKWEDNEVDNLRRLQEKFVADIAALPKGHQRQSEEEALQGELTGLESRRSYAQDELKALDHNIDSKNRELQNARGQLKEVTPKYNEQSQGLVTLRAQLQTFTRTVAQAEDQIFAGFCQRLGYTDIRAYEAQEGSQQQEAAQKKLEFTTQRSKLDSQLSFETERLKTTTERITRLERDVNEAQQMIDNLEQEKETMTEELDTLIGELDHLNEQLAVRKGESDERAEKVAEHRREVAKRSKSIESTTKKIEASQEEASAANMGRYNTLKRCRMEKIDIPLKQGSRKIDSLPQGDEGASDVMDIDDPSQQVPEVQDYGIDIDYDELEDDLQDDDSDKTEKSLQAKIDELEKELEKMAPNARANERLASTEERLRDYDNQYKEALRAYTEAKRNFEKVKKKRFDLFDKAYEHISSQIDQVYKELTRTTSFPLGGMA